MARVSCASVSRHEPAPERTRCNNAQHHRHLVANMYRLLRRSHRTPRVDARRRGQMIMIEIALSIEPECSSRFALALVGAPDRTFRIRERCAPTTCRGTPCPACGAARTFRLRSPRKRPVLTCVIHAWIKPCSPRVQPRSGRSHRRLSKTSAARCSVARYAQLAAIAAVVSVILRVDPAHRQHGSEKFATRSRELARAARKLHII